MQFENVSEKLRSVFGEITCIYLLICGLGFTTRLIMLVTTNNEGNMKAMKALTSEWLVLKEECSWGEGSSE